MLHFVYTLIKLQQSSSNQSICRRLTIIDPFFLIDPSSLGYTAPGVPRPPEPLEPIVLCPLAERTNWRVFNLMCSKSKWKELERTTKSIRREE